MYEMLYRELTAFDPYLCCGRYILPDRQPAIGSTDEYVWIACASDWTGIWLERAIKEGIESLVRFQVRLSELTERVFQSIRLDERNNMLVRARLRIEQLALLDRLINEQMLNLDSEVADQSVGVCWGKCTSSVHI